MNVLEESICWVQSGLPGKNYSFMFNIGFATDSRLKTPSLPTTQCFTATFNFHIGRPKFRLDKALRVQKIENVSVCMTFVYILHEVRSFDSKPIPVYPAKVQYLSPGASNHHTFIIGERKQRRRK